MKLDRKTIENDMEYLRQISTPIDFENDNYLEYIKKLREYCATHYCYAMAPVQIGIPKRLIYVKNTQQSMDNNVTKGYDEGIIYINPTIVDAKGQTRFLEGCESCMYRENGENIHLTAIVDRPYSLVIEYYDINGNKKTKTIEGFEATIFSHEYDHLNGILHMDRSSKIFKMTIEEMRAYRNEHPYYILTKDSQYISRIKTNKTKKIY